MQLRNRRYLVPALCAAVAAFSHPVAAQETPVRVAIYNSAPFGGDPPGGYCFDLMTVVTDRAGLEVAVFQPMIVADMVRAIAHGAADILCAALAPTTQRREAGLAFTSAILTNSEAVVVLATDETVYRSLADFRGFVVGGETGSNFVNLVRNAGVDVREFASFADAYPALLSGEIKAFIRSAPAFAYQQTALAMWSDLRVANGYVPTQVSYGAIAVQAANTALLGRVQAALESVKADGTLAEIAGWWGMAAPPF